MVRLVLVLLAALASAPAAAQSFALVSMPVLYFQNPALQHAGPDGVAADTGALASTRLASAAITIPHGFGMAQAQHTVPRQGVVDYGPFRVIDATRIALVAATDAASPGWFARALRDNPRLARLDMVECPGTLDDRANMRLGRMIRSAGLATHVPANGSVRSGAVELFLAGTSQTIEDGAEFAVHSWRDVDGREAADYAADSPENRAYLDYYREMGMSDGQARSFYDFTNSVPHHRARWLDARAMRPWIGPGRAPQPVAARQAAPLPTSAPAPRIAYAGLT